MKATWVILGMVRPETPHFETRFGILKKHKPDKSLESDLSGLISWQFFESVQGKAFP